MTPNILTHFNTDSTPYGLFNAHRIAMLQKPDHINLNAQIIKTGEDQNIVEGVQNYFNKTGIFNIFSIYSFSFPASYIKATHELVTQNSNILSKSGRLILSSLSNPNSAFYGMPREVVNIILKLERLSSIAFPNCNDFQAMIWQQLPKPLNEESNAEICKYLERSPDPKNCLIQ